MTQAGFAKVDITPRVGVPLCGFGPFLNRRSIAVRDRLWARALAVEHDDTLRSRELVREATGLDPAHLLVACTHTHSGPDSSARRIG
jgi:hypothetical protein